MLHLLLAADHPPSAPPTIRKALHTIGIHITQRVDNARWLPTAAWNFRQLSRAYDLLNFAATSSSRNPHGRVPALAARTIAATWSSRPSSPASAAHGWAEPKAGTRIDGDYEQFRVRAQTLLDRPALMTPAPQSG